MADMIRKIDAGPANRTTLKYDEALARVVLEYAFPSVFGGLLVLDRPDLQNPQQGVGVEVTNCRCEGAHDGRQAAEIYRTLKVVGSLSPVPGTILDAKEQVVAAIRRKQNKLNSDTAHYAPCSTYGLFLFLPYDLAGMGAGAEGAAGELAQVIWRELEGGEEKHYTSVFILSKEALFAFFSRNHTVTIFHFNADILHNLCRLAQEEVGRANQVRGQYGRQAGLGFANSKNLAVLRTAHIQSIKGRQSDFQTAG